MSTTKTTTAKREKWNMENSRQTELLTALLEVSTVKGLKSSSRAILKGLESLGYIGADFSTTDIHFAEMINESTHRRKRGNK